MDLYFHGATVLTCNDEDSVQQLDVHVVDGQIHALRPPAAPPPGCTTIDLRGRWLLPGFVQTHTHVVQTLFRGMADDLALLDWLSQRIWPLERAHDTDSVYWSSRLGLTELLLGGTTAILDMATVHHTERVFEAAQECGIRAFIGKAMMDRDNEAALYQDTTSALDEAVQLRDRWHERGRLHYAFAPRFVPSCTETLLQETANLARERNCLVHTHASENTDEVAQVRRMTGRDNVRYLHDVGISGSDVVLAHCIHLSDDEQALLASTGSTVAHCPSSNLKLGSGIAPIPALLAQGVRCTLGADGAPCNNRMDMFTEMRLAALIQKPRAGATVMPATTVLGMATREGARALGLQTGIIAAGRPADLISVDPDVIHAWGDGDPRSTVVYAMTPAAVRDVWIGGDHVVHDGAVMGWNNDETRTGCRAALTRLRTRADI